MMMCTCVQGSETAITAGGGAAGLIMISLFQSDTAYVPRHAPWSGLHVCLCAGCGRTGSGAGVGSSEPRFIVYFAVFCVWLIGYLDLSVSLVYSAFASV